MPDSLKDQMGAKSIVALIAIISAAPPIATDLFLPALTELPSFFHTDEATINLVLVSFFGFMAVGMLVLGPLSDRYGRKPVLFSSLGLFALSAIAGAFCTNVYALIALRVLQGIGGGGMVAMGTALVKDCFDGETRQKVLVATMAISVVAPMAAPVIGAVILSFTTWQGTFVAQAVVGVLALPFALRLREPCAPQENGEVGIGATLSRLVVVGRNRCFLYLLLVTALCTACYMTYVSSASYIYMGYFGLDKVTYSFFFAANAALSALGSYLVIVAQKRITPRRSMAASLVLGAVAGVLILTVGGVSPWTFLATYALYTLSGGFLRPLVTNVLLSQQSGDTGSASSLINTVYTLFGCGGMLLASVPWPTYVFGLGISITVTGFASLLLFCALLKSKYRAEGL